MPGDLAGRGPLGPKPTTTPSKARKPLPRVSPKKRAQKAAERAAGASEHMAAVAALPCLVCGVWPVEVHHVTGDGKPRSDFRVIPLCYECHRGPNGYHNAKATWIAKNGPDYLLLDAVAKML
jgi:hypothetical protein